MYLYGASGHAKVIMDILKAQDTEIDGLLDDNPEINELMGILVLHNRADLYPIIISIGNCRIRKMISERIAQALKATPFDKAIFGTAIHPTAIISESANVGAGSVVMHGAIIQTCAQIGRHCIVNTGARIDHECEIGDYVHIAPGVTLSGDVHVGEGSWIGVGATVIQGVRIGKNVMIGAGSVVVKDIPDNCTAYGVPCRVVKTDK